MSWIKEIIFGHFSSLDSAIKYPKRVRKLDLSVFGYSLLDYCWITAKILSNL